VNNHANARVERRAVYHYGDKEVSKIFRTLQKELDASKAKFVEEDNHKKRGFSLD
jgi:hypothetical protein